MRGWLRHASTDFFRALVHPTFERFSLEEESRLLLPVKRAKVNRQQEMKRLLLIAKKSR